MSRLTANGTCTPLPSVVKRSPDKHPYPLAQRLQQTGARLSRGGHSELGWSNETRLSIAIQFPSKSWGAA